jgi:hypothetical protein
VATIVRDGAFASIDCRTSLEMKKHFLGFSAPLVRAMGSTYSAVLLLVQRDTGQRMRSRESNKIEKETNGEEMRGSFISVPPRFQAPE